MKKDLQNGSSPDKILSMSGATREPISLEIKNGHGTVLGPIDIASIPTLERLLAKAVVESLDFSRAEIKDDAAVALLSLLDESRYQLEGLDRPTLEAMAEAGRFAAVPPATGQEPAPGFFEATGRQIVGGIRDLGETLEYLGRVTDLVFGRLIHPRRHPLRDFTAIFCQVGARAVLITVVIGFLLGLILAFESAVPLHMMGAEVYVADLIGIAIFRELAVLVAAIVMAGRTASAYAAEIGTMVVNDEISAMRSMGIDPVGYLVLPRVIASACALPLLSLFAGLAGIVGGYLVLALYDYSLPVFLNHLFAFTKLKDLLGSLFKAFVFGLLIGGVGCHRGLRTAGGANAVGASTTAAVVGAILIFAIADGIFAVLFKALGI